MLLTQLKLDSDSKIIHDTNLFNEINKNVDGKVEKINRLTKTESFFLMFNIFDSNTYGWNIKDSRDE